MPSLFWKDSLGLGHGQLLPKRGGDFKAWRMIFQRHFFNSSNLSKKVPRIEATILQNPFKDNF
jgi:hypothetical protein